MRAGEAPGSSRVLRVGDGDQSEGLLGSLLESERSARLMAERNADRMRLLARVATALSSAVTARQVAMVIVEEAKAAIGARAAGVWLLDGHKRQLDLLATEGMSPDLQKYVSSYPLDAPNPLCRAVQVGLPVWIDSWESFARNFPTSEARMRHFPSPRPEAFACLPLRIEREVIGGLSFSFYEARRLDEDERAFVVLLAQHCAQGLERARLYERALEAVRMRDDFLSIAGHELRTPLTTLHMQVQLLIEEHAQRGTIDSSAGVLRSLTRLLTLANELLDVSRIRAGRLRLEVERLELCALVREVAPRAVAATRPPRPTLNIDAGAHIEGSWDPLRLELIITNLVTNACKYGGGKPVDIRVAPRPGGAEIVVKDRGAGIELCDQARIFERFERGAGASDFAGLGLGLWIARELAQAHGGQILVQSEPGQGAQFTVLLPLAAPAGTP
jgi:signal transduction histidine kinase